MVGKLFRVLKSLVRRPSVERELDEEVRFHLEMEIERHVRNGMSRKEARLQANKDFGGFEQIKEECRDARGTRLIDNLWQDLRFGARTLAKRPGFSIAVIAVLALGIGANTAIFSAVNGVLLQPLDYEHGERLLLLRQQAPTAGIRSIGFSPKELIDYREMSQTLDAIVEYHMMWFILLGGERPARVQTGVVSWDFFDVFGTEPHLGRSFRPEDEAHGSEAVLILSHDYWLEAFEGDPNVVGRLFEMNDQPHRVIGVLPPIPEYPNDNDVYMPVSHCPFRSDPDTVADRDARASQAFGRMKPGVSIDDVEADFATITDELSSKYPESYPNDRGLGVESVPLREELTHGARPTFVLLLATAGMVLLIASANVANLLLARAMRREREMAIRVAMGAGRARLLRQMTVESLMLTLAGGGLGLILAINGLDLLVSFADRFTPRAVGIAIDGWVLAFALGVSVLIGLIFGLLPALPVGRSPAESLREGFSDASASVGKQFARNGLVVAQVAISFVLLISAGLMVRSLIQLNRVDPGFDPENVLTMRIDLNFSKYTHYEENIGFFSSLLDRLQEHPDVTTAAVSGTFPLNEISPGSEQFMIEGPAVADMPDRFWADFIAVSPDYFRTVGVPVISGRAFTGDDLDQSPPVVIVNESLARHHWGGRSPVGERISPDGEGWFEIVGVVGDVKQESLIDEAEDQMYVPLDQATPLSSTVLVRTAGEPTILAGVVQDLVRDIDDQQPVDNFRTLEKVRSDSISSPRLTTILISLFAALSVTITAAGIGAVIALAVSQRTHEIGVRTALGASSLEVLWMVMRQGLTLIAAGLLLGVVGSLALVRFMTAVLFEVEPTDPVTFLAVAIMVVSVASAACFIPARRAVTIDPMSALRAD